MKKLLILLAFLLPALAAFPQGFISVSGTVTDDSTGLPFANHPVVIRSDSANGFIYYNTEYTNAQGFYVDTIPVTMGISGTLYIETWDCLQNLHSDVWNYVPMQSHVSNFSICGSPSGQCQANFSYIITTSTPPIVFFTDLSTGTPGIVSWLWNFGDPASGTTNTSTLQNPSHQYNNAGTYTVCLTVTSSSGCTSTYCANVYLGNGGNCHAYYFTTIDSLNTSMVHFIDQSSSTSGTIVQWHWNFGDGSVSTISFPGNPNVTHIYPDPSLTYVACLTITGSDSSCYDVFCDSIRIGGGGGCQANFTYSIPTFVGIPVQFQDLSVSNSGPIAYWQWNFGDPASGTNNTSTIQNPWHTFSAPGVFNVCLTIQGTDSTCYDTYCLQVIIDSSTYCQAAFSYSMLPPAYTNVQFTDQSIGNPVAWQWMFGDGASSTQQNPQYQYAMPGTYTVCLTISSEDPTYGSCTSSTCQTITIIDSINYHNVYGQVFAGTFPVSGCMVMIFAYDTVPAILPFSAVTIADSSGVYYFNGIPTGDYYILAIPLDSGNYLPTYYGDVINWQAATLISLGMPQNPYNIHLVQADGMTAGPGSASGQINMGDVSNAMVDKITMILKNDQGEAMGFVRVATDGTFDFPSLAYGTYYLHPEMPGVASDDVMITLTAEKPHAEIVMTYTGNRIMGIRGSSTIADGWQIFPNPVTDQVSIRFNLTISTTVNTSITNLAGQVLAAGNYSLQNGINTLSLPTANLPAGVYLLRISSAEGLNIYSKLVKAK